MAFEVSSRRTYRVDIGAKKELCEKLGVKEYYLYDPEKAYITPRLQGYRLDAGGRYAPIEWDYLPPSGTRPLTSTRNANGS